MNFAKIINRKRLDNKVLKMFMEEIDHDKISLRASQIESAKSLAEEINQDMLCLVSMEIKKKVLKDICEKIKELDKKIDSCLENKNLA